MITVGLSVRVVRGLPCPVEQAQDHCDHDDAEEAVEADRRADERFVQPVHRVVPHPTSQQPT